MRKFVILLLVLIPTTLIAQITFDLKGRVNKKISSSIIEGSSVVLKEINKNEMLEKTAVISFNGKDEIISWNQFDKISYTPTNLKEFWQFQEIQYTVYENIFKNGMQYRLRNELEEETIEYINFVENNNLNFDDSYLESYLYSLIYRICPSKLDDGRPGILNLKILKDISPNAFIFPNGSLFISTGLLSTINSEDELIGVLSHEVSHFVLDHSIVNINKAAQRQRRAEFWAAFATGIAAVADVYTASKNEYYVPGALTMSTAMLAYSVAESVNERMGLKYSQEQELEADKCAVELMKYLKINPTALSSALDKIKRYCIITGNYLALTGAGTHPSLDKRIIQIGKPILYNDIEFDKKISFVNSFNAIVEFNNQHFSSSANLINRNIKTNVATEEDYVLLAMITLYMNDTEIKNLEALEYINKAKSLNVYPTINLSKQEAIVLIRLKKLEEAKKSLLKYIENLDKERLNLEKTINTREWSLLNRYIDNEYEWTVKMLNKVQKL